MLASMVPYTEHTTKARWNIKVPGTFPLYREGGERMEG